MPPTAGLRVLCMDGGGVRGVQPLVYLKYLQSELSFFGGSIENMFDYVCGTSAGKSFRHGLFPC
jgi:patatin-like phospholipase/acyl hydrolase